MSAARREQERFLALEPDRSVAVEACAGSGKTWLLTARLLRLLLAGVKPGEILAITYTRKAAREIEARLRGLLQFLLIAPEEAVLRELSARGLSAAQAQIALPATRHLFESVLHAEPAITITTFHGWFARLLSGAPLDSGLVGRSLDPAATSLLDEAWAQLAATCARQPEQPVAQALLWLYGELGAFTTTKLIRAFIERRAEWRVWLATLGGSEPLAQWLAECFGKQHDPLETLFSPLALDELEDFARLLQQNTATDQALAGPLAQAVIEARAGSRQGLFDATRTAFLTAKNEARARKASAAQQKRLGAAGEARYMDLHVTWSARLIEVLGVLQDQYNAELNQRAILVGTELLAILEQLKLQRRAMDFSDLEAEVDQLLSREGSAAWLQARLDARYRHILLDEFQDTNPLQWRILRAWLDAYKGAEVQRPSVFLVGDPKQSIYRFRRAEPKLFEAAAAYFVGDFGAARIGNAHTFRNAQGIVDMVNAVFAAEPQFVGFTPQTAERADWPSRIEILPLIQSASGDEATPQQDFALRHPLQEARVEVDDQRREEEAALLAHRIGEIVGAWQVRDATGADRPARYSDILILTRRKTQLASYEAALRKADIPFFSPGQGGLLATLEAQDLLATLRFLADPADNLMLAQLLRSPAFAMSDALLLKLSESGGAAWWQVLQTLASSGNDPEIERAVRLIQGWLAQAAHLPAHDLIDRVYAESDWLARTRAVVPPALWPGVHANLDALLELSLNVDAGRYPSLTRFVDELERLSVSDEEAPDEGLVPVVEARAASSQGRVRIMTIHGAKGLEAPIVWLIDANAVPRKGEGYSVVMDWPAEADAPAHFSLLGRLAESGPARVAILEREKLATEREELNLLYVAMTRAEQVFIASGIEAARASSGITAWKRLKAALDELNDHAGAHWRGGLPSALSPKTPEAVASTPTATIAVPVPAVGQLRRAAEGAQTGDGMVFGTAMHAWLEAATANLPLPLVSPDVERAARKIILQPALRRFFDSSSYRRAGNETAFVDSDGRAGRIDRWVETEDAIWVLDYKSGAPAPNLLESYRAQLQRYRAVLQTIFTGRPVRCMLVFTDGEPLELD